MIEDLLSMDLGTGIGVAGSGVSLAAIIISLLQWSLKRNVGHEDKWRDDTSKEIVSLREELTKSREREAKRDIDASEARGELRGVANNFGEMRGSINQIASALETGREKQAAFYREELQKVEQTMRQELSRHIHPELPEKVAKLETTVEKLEAAFEALPRRKR